MLKRVDDYFWVDTDKVKSIKVIPDYDCYRICLNKDTNEILYPISFLKLEKATEKMDEIAKVLQKEIGLYE